MGLIKEPLNVDFIVIDSPWTEAERQEFSEIIKQKKAKFPQKNANMRLNNAFLRKFKV